MTKREMEFMDLVREGLKPDAIAQKMGIKPNSIGPMASTLRAKGYLPPLPPGTRGARIQKPMTKADLEKRKLKKVLKKESTGLALQQVQLADPKPLASVEETPRKRRRSPQAQREGVTITMRALAERLDDKIQQHMQEGGSLEPWHRWAIVLAGEILGR
jgi:hypothetical protein